MELADSPIQRRAPTSRTQLDETSWVDVIRGFARDTEPVFARLLAETQWQQNRMIRGGRKVDDPRLDGSISRADADRDPLFRFARLVLEARYRVRLHGVQLVLYRDGRDSMGFHRDDEMVYLDRTIIVGLAFGATRPFVITSFDRQQQHTFELEAGDLYVMGGRCQADWLHGVPKVDEAGPKISAVWRWADRRGRRYSPSPWGP